MAELETFRWKTQRTTPGTETARTRSAQFGDGYKQVVADGINNISGSWYVTIVAQADEMRAIRNFLRSHGGYRAFKWTEPLGDVVLVRAGTWTPTPIGGGVYSISTTFEQAFTQDS